MFGVCFADDTDHAFALDHAAILTNPLNARPDFHLKYPKILAKNAQSGEQYQKFAENPSASSKKTDKWHKKCPAAAGWAKNAD